LKDSDQKKQKFKVKKNLRKLFFFYNYPISKHREFKQQRTPKLCLVVDLLFKKIKERKKNEEKIQFLKKS